MKTVNIQGKNYVMVNERIAYFRSEPKYKDWTITSHIVSNESGSCVIEATICDETGRTRAMGHAREIDGDSFINKTSYLENCETSAWGRALGCLGIGIDTSIASAEEVGNAVKQQNPRTEKAIDYKSRFWGYMKTRADEQGVNIGRNTDLISAVIAEIGRTAQCLNVCAGHEPEPYEFPLLPTMKNTDERWAVLSAVMSSFDLKTAINLHKAQMGLGKTEKKEKEEAK